MGNIKKLRHRVTFTSPSDQSEENTVFHLFENGSESTLCGQHINSQPFHMSLSRQSKWVGTMCETCLTK